MLVKNKQQQDDRHVYNNRCVRGHRPDVVRHRDVVLHSVLVLSYSPDAGAFQGFFSIIMLHMCSQTF